MAINAWKTRSKLTSKFGKGKDVLAEYEKIKWITMPLDENHLLYITSQVRCDALSLVDKIKIRFNQKKRSNHLMISNLLIL